MTERCESNGCIEADNYFGMVRVRSTQTGTVMQATGDEWIQFIADVKSGKWDEFTDQVITAKEATNA